MYKEAASHVDSYFKNDKFQEFVIHFIMAQLSINQGLQAFGKRGEEAVQKELKQIHDLNAYKPLVASKLTSEEKKNAVPSLMFLTEKQYGKIKARKCADGRKQREYINKQDAASPTISLDSIFITGVIETHENRDVVVIDLPGAFQHAKLEDEDEVMIVMEGCLAEMMVMTEPKVYRKYVTINSRGQPVFDVKLQKALCGLLKSALFSTRSFLLTSWL